MMKILLVFACFVTLLFPTHESLALAQTWTLRGGETFTSLDSNERLLYLTADDGKVLVSSDTGTTWHDLRSVLPSVQCQAWFDSRVGFFGGNGIERTTDAGKTWSVLSVTASNVRAMLFSSGGNLLAVSDSLVYRSSDKGRSWDSTVLSHSSKLYALARIGTSLFAGGENGTLLRSDDNGGSWLPISSPADTNRIVEIATLGDSTLLLHGESPLFRSTNLGRSWSIDTSVILRYGSRIVPHDGAVNIIGQREPETYVSNDGGRSWSVEGDPVDYLMSNYYAACFLSRDLGLSVGSGGTIRRTANGARTWETLSWSPFRVSGDQMWRTGQFWDSARAALYGFGGMILETRDAGVTWNMRENDSVYGFSHVYFTDPAHGVMLTDYGDIPKGYLMVTYDSGAYWHGADVSDSAGYFYGIGGMPNDLWISSGFYLLRSRDSAKTWLSTGIIPSLAVGEIYEPAKDSIFLVGHRGGYPHDTAYIMRSYDGGKSWNVYHVADEFWEQGATFLNGRIGFVFGRAGSVMKTTDGGETWRAKPVANDYFYDMLFVSDSIGFLVGQEWSIYKTTDKGETWLPDTIFNPGSSRSFLQLRKFGSQIFAFGENVAASLEVKTSDGPRTVTAQAQSRINPYLYIITYPNPATEELSIKVYGLYSIKNSEQHLEIRDMLGRKIRDLSLELNRANNGSWSEFKVSISDLAPGVYYAVYQADGQVKVRSFIVEQ